PVPRDDLAGLPFALAGGVAGRAITEAILIEIAQRDFNDLFAVRSDDVLFGDQLLQVFADRFLDALVMTGAVLQAPPLQIPRYLFHFHKSAFSLSTFRAPADC